MTGEEGDGEEDDGGGRSKFPDKLLLCSSYEAIYCTEFTH